MNCIICGNPAEVWPGGSGYGNNPDPWPTPTAAKVLIDKANEQYRCCNDCNALVVIPLRISLVRQ